MRILIGGAPDGEGGEELKHELKETLPFRQIMDKLRAWAESQKLYIVDYRIAAKPEFADKEILNSDEIDVINLQLGDQTDLVESNLRELIDYTDRVGLHLAKVIQEGKTLGDQDAQDVKTGGVFIAESVDALSNHLNPENSEILTSAVNAFNLNPDLIEKINGLAAIQNQLRLWLRQTEFSRISPEEAVEKVKNFREQIPEMQTQLEQIAAKFTQGREQDALTLLESVSQTLVDAIILMRIAGDAKKQHTEKLVTLLGDLTNAVDSRDLVTAADIADFDLRDILREIA